MQAPALLFILCLLASLSYWLARHRAIAAVGGTGSIRQLHSLPKYYGYYAAICCAVPAALLLVVWLALEDKVLTHIVVQALPTESQSLPESQLELLVNDIKNLLYSDLVDSSNDPVVTAASVHYQQLQTHSHLAMTAIVLGLAVIGGLLGWRTTNPNLAARNQVERVIKWFLILCSSLAVFTTLGIVLSVLFESLRFFKTIPILSFIFGLDWSPQIAIRADQVGASGAFGAVPLFAGTMLISGIAMVVAVPIGLMSAIYLSEYANPRVRSLGKPMLEILAGIPTVVYGFFAALTVAPFLRDAGASFGLSVSSESALAAGLVMGIMIIPFVSSLSDDVINAVPQSLRDGSYALGATRSETIRQVVIPAALPGIVGGILLAVSRAVGETMIVVMAAGMSARLTANPFESVTTVTVQIVTLLVGDQEFDSPKTLAAFALGLMLFVTTLVLNIIALRVVRRYREQYE